MHATSCCNNKSIALRSLACCKILLLLAQWQCFPHWQEAYHKTSETSKTSKQEGSEEGINHPSNQHRQLLPAALIAGDAAGDVAGAAEGGDRSERGGDQEAITGVKNFIDHSIKMRKEEGRGFPFLFSNQFSPT